MVEPLLGVDSWPLVPLFLAFLLRRRMHQLGRHTCMSMRLRLELLLHLVVRRWLLGPLMRRHRLDEV